MLVTFRCRERVRGPPAFPKWPRAAACRCLGAIFLWQERLLYLAQPTATCCIAVIPRRRPKVRNGSRHVRPSAEFVAADQSFESGVQEGDLRHRVHSTHSGRSTNEVLCPAAEVAGPKRAPCSFEPRQLLVPRAFQSAPAPRPAPNFGGAPRRHPPRTQCSRTPKTPVTTLEVASKTGAPNA